MDPTQRWLFVSRPLVGATLEGGPALLRELIPALGPEAVSYFGDRPLRPASSGDEVIRIPRLPLHDGGANDLLERAVMGRALLAAERRNQPLHLFFDPGPLTERIAAGLAAAPRQAVESKSLALRASASARSWLAVARSLIRVEGPRHLARRRPAPVVQTLTCATGLETCARMLAALDGVVALSEDTRSRLIGAGLPSRVVHRIYPGVRPGRAISPAELEGRRAILYAGELDAGATDRLIELARMTSEPALRGWTLIIASRPDDIIERIERVRLGRELAGAIGSGRVEIHGEVPDLRALQARCSMQVWVSDKIHRRLDLPLALLEGLANGLPLVAIDRAPVREVFTIAEARGREIGRRVDPVPQAIVAAVSELAQHPEQLLRLSADAATLVHDAFTSARMAADYCALHRELTRRFASSS